MEPGAPVSAVAGGPPVQIPIGRRACQYDDTALVIGAPWAGCRAAHGQLL